MLYKGLILALGIAAIDAAPAAPCNSEDAGNSKPVLAAL